MGIFAMTAPNIGTLREAFVVSQLKVKHELEYGKNAGDFIVDRTYTFEVGGPDKDFSQVAGVDNAYLLVDDIERASGNRLPIWMAGLLY